MYPKLQVITKIIPSGDISTRVTYFNNETPRFNLQSFIISEIFKSGNLWDEKLRQKADYLIKEGKYFFMFEDSKNNVYTIRKNPL